MKAIPWSSTTDRVPRTPVLSRLAFLLMAIIFCQAAAQEPKAAVFKVREVDFSYRSAIAIYSCDALRGRVASILRAVGARDDVQVEVDDCESFVVPSPEPIDTGQIPSDRFRNQRTNREQLTQVHVRLMLPTEVTPQVLTEMERDKRRRELVSRVTGNPAAMLDDPIVFWAQRQPVTLSRQSIGLGPAECELLEQMSMSVFPRLDMRVVHGRFSCNRHQVSRIPPQLTVEALVATAFGAGDAQQLPAAGESDSDPSAPEATQPAQPATAIPPE